MQTFLPYEDFAKSAQCLDRQRLGKQRVEVLQILKALNGETSGWANHPATRMWRGSESYLIEYGKAICLEWIGRGYKDTCYGKIVDYRNKFQDSTRPTWLGNPDFHRSHQSNLVRKDPKFYGPKFSGVADNLAYVWPS
jgi:hypothetical protein